MCIPRSNFTSLGIVDQYHYFEARHFCSFKHCLRYIIEYDIYDSASGNEFIDIEKISQMKTLLILGNR